MIWVGSKLISNLTQSKISPTKRSPILNDVRQLVGHAELTSTQGYLEENIDAQKKNLWESFRAGTR
jgi:hypothetical protein